MGNSSSDNKLGSTTTTEEACLGADLTGKLAIVTGCSAGIGVATVAQLCKQGCTVVMANRNLEKSKTTKAKILQQLAPPSSSTKTKTTNETKEETKENNNYNDRLLLLTLDLSSLQSIYDFVQSFISLNLSPLRLNYLVNNAGIACNQSFELSKDNYEMQFATNFLGHFYLTVLLINYYHCHTKNNSKNDTNNTENSENSEKNSKNSDKNTQYSAQTVESGGHELRIVNVSSAMHSYAPNNLKNMIINGIDSKTGPNREDYGPIKNYGLSKTLNILFSKELARRYEDIGIYSYSLHPGAIDTDITRELPQFIQKGMSLVSPLYMKSVSQGAATTVYVCCEDSKVLNNGGYYVDCNDASDKSISKLLKSIGFGSKGSKGGKDECDEVQRLMWEWGELLIKERKFSLIIENVDKSTVKKEDETKSKE